MRWLSFLILAYLLLAMHVGLRADLTWGGAAPNLVLLGVVFICINAPREPALMGAFILGISQDLLTQGPLGVYALAYGGVALLITSVQHAIYREHYLTHVVMALVAGILTGIVLLLHGWVHPMLHPPAGPEAHEAAVAAVGRSAARVVAGPGWKLAPQSMGLVVRGVLMTAVAAPIIVGILQRMKRLFGFQPSRVPTMALRSRRREGGL